jgi:hypothetical protein
MTAEEIAEVAAEQRFEAWAQQRRLHRVFQTVQNYAVLCLWDTEQAIATYEKTSA